MISNIFFCFLTLYNFASKGEHLASFQSSLFLSPYFVQINLLLYLQLDSLLAYSYLLHCTRMDKENFQYIALMLYALALCLTSSIRSCFLADAFSRRNFSGTEYGALESSLFIGFLLMFLLGATQIIMRKINNLRILLVANLIALAVVSLTQGLVYFIEDNLAMMITSFAFRILQGVFSFSSNLVQLDFTHAIFPEKFDLANGVGLLGNFLGQAVAGSMGCLLYDNFGYLAPFLFSSGITTGVAGFVFLTVPAITTHLCNDEKERLSTSKCSAQERNSICTKLLVFPMIATMLVNSNYGIIQVRYIFSISSFFAEGKKVKEMV